MNPTRTLPLALAVLLAQTARAQDYRAVDRRDLVDHLNGTLSAVVEGNAPLHELVGDSTTIDLPESMTIPFLAAGAAVVAPIAVSASAGGITWGTLVTGATSLRVTMPVLAGVGAGAAAALYTDDVMDGYPTASGATGGVIVMGIQEIYRIYKNTRPLQWLWRVSAVLFGSVLLGESIAAYHNISYENPIDPDDLIDGNGYYEYLPQNPLHDFIQNRTEVHYRLTAPNGDDLNGSCLAFYSLEEETGGGHVLHYVLDACSHDVVFPQSVEARAFDVRIGLEGVDAWDKFLGQDRIVARGSIPIP